MINTHRYKAPPSSRPSSWESTLGALIRSVPVLHLSVYR
jgi:hypothetical protein